MQSPLERIRRQNEDIETRYPNIRVEDGVLDPFPEELDWTLLNLRTYLDRGIWGGVSNRDYALLINDTGTDFVMSDSPVARINLANSVNRIGTHIARYESFGAKGLVFFYPTSPQRAIVFFDWRTHEVIDRDERTGRIEVNREEDVRKMNGLQANRCLSRVYFLEREMDTEEILRDAMEIARAEMRAARSTSRLPSGDPTSCGPHGGPGIEVSFLKRLEKPRACSGELPAPVGAPPLLAPC